MLYNLNLLHRLFIVTILATALPLWAKEQFATDISSVSPIPAAVRARLPRTGTSRFYGEAPRIGPQKQDVLIHFYSVPVKDAKILEKTPQAMNCTIDLFTRSGSKRDTELRLLNSLHFNDWGTMVNKGDNVSASLLWLAPATRQTPVINLAFNSGSAMYELWRRDVLLVFTQGLQRPPVVEMVFSTAYGDVAQYTRFYDLDTRGMMMVTTNYTRHVQTQPSQRINANLYWNGKGFAARPLKTALHAPAP